MDSEKDAQMVKSVLLFIFLLTALAFTAYQTAKGYESAIGTVPAWLLAGLCAGMLGVLAMSLRSALRRSERTWTIWLGCLIVAGVSFAGNFNSFYTGFIKNELIKDELEAKRRSLDELSTRAETALADKGFTQLQRDVEALKKQLRAQIVNDGNPGLGLEARLVLKQIEQKLKETFTPETATDKTSQSLNRLADRYDAQIDAKLDAKRIGLVENAVERQKAQVLNKAKYGDAIKSVDEALSRIALDKSPTSQADAIRAIQKAVEAYSRIGAQTKSSLPTSVAFEYDTKITLESDKAGSIDHSFNSALKHLNHFAVWLSAFLAFFIDMGVPMVIRMSYSRSESIASPSFRSNKNQPNVI